VILRQVDCRARQCVIELRGWFGSLSATSHEKAIGGRQPADVRFTPVNGRNAKSDSFYWSIRRSPNFELGMG
jgi:hypothetical protein